MSNICKTVTLRTRKIKNGEQLSFYLDYYPGYRDESTMKVMRHESLGIYIYAKPKNQREKDYNDRMREKAEALRCRRYESIVNERYDFFDKEKMKGSFLDYFKDKAYKKNTKWERVHLTHQQHRRLLVNLPRRAAHCLSRAQDFGESQRLLGTYRHNSHGERASFSSGTCQPRQYPLFL